MKNTLLIIASCAVLLLEAGCKDKNQPESIIWTADKPAWTAPADYDMSSSMTAVVKVDLSALYTAEQLAAANYRYSPDDLLAAFSGTTCLGVGTYKEEYGAYWLYIAAPENGGEVTIRHYSATLKNIFVSESFPFSNDTNLGSASKPYTPSWRVDL
jgi:hypothetical protein